MQNISKYIQRNYEATVKRGLITPETSKYDFLDKMDDELYEIKESLYLHNSGLNKAEAERILELWLEAANELIFFGVDIEPELLKIVEKNERRANINTNNKQS